MGKVAIVGAGLVGGGWGIVFARAGFEVALFDGMPGVAARTHMEIGGQLTALAEEGLLAESPDAIGARLFVADDLATALDGVTYVQESVLERVDVKRAVFAEIAQWLPRDALVGSSSSGIPASLYSDHVDFRERCLVVHPVNPPYLVPVVELVPAPWTLPETLIAVRSLMKQVGQAPVTLSREIDGFVLNRLQAVLLMEAWRLVEDGIASVEDIDLTISEGLGLRWSFMGPFETIDLNAPGGVADYARRLGGLYQGIAASTAEHRPWDEALIRQVETARRSKLDAADLEVRRRWRDRRLMALAAHKRAVLLAESDETAAGQSGCAGEIPK